MNSTLAQEPQPEYGGDEEFLGCDYEDDYNPDEHTVNLDFMFRCFELALFYHRETGDQKESRYILFNRVLSAWYDPMMYEGMEPIVGHIMYRLSDLVDEEERQNMMIYVNPNGSLVDLDEERQQATNWGTLEDWRSEWQTRHPIVPRFRFLPELVAGTDY